MPRSGYAPNYGYSLRVFDEQPMGYAEDFAIYPDRGEWVVSGRLADDERYESLDRALLVVGNEIAALMEEDA